MWLLLCVVVLARAALAQPSVGVCVVSTGRDYDSGNSTEGLGRIATLFASLSGQGVRRCLVSDFRVHSAAAAATLQRVDKDAVIDDWFDTKTPAELRAAEPELADQYQGMSILTMVLHRLARIIEYATPRYDVPLYLDDDMYACPGVEPLLGAALLDLAATADVRLVERWLSQGQLDPGTEESRAVAQWLYEGRPPHLFRRFDLQGGAVLLVKSPSQQRWARAARQAYVDLWTAVRDKSHVARCVEINQCVGCTILH